METAGFCLLAMLSSVGLYHLLMLWWKHDERSAIANYDKWIIELNEALHELIDADIRVAQLEASLMNLVGKVPPDTSYQAIRRLGLGRKVEQAILAKMELLGIGSKLPEVSPETTPSLSPVSRRVAQK